MKPPPVPNRFPHFFRGFQAFSKSRRCRSQHRQSPLRANQAAPLPTFEKSAGVTPCTTNAFLQRETSSRIHLGASAWKETASGTIRSSRRASCSARRTAAYRSDQDKADRDIRRPVQESLVESRRVTQWFQAPSESRASHS